MKMNRKTWLRHAGAVLALAATASTATTAAFAQSAELRVGLIPSEDAQAMIRASQQVMDQLATRTGMKVRPFVANDYNGVIEALRSNKIDIAFLGPFSYVLANQVAGAEAFAVAVTKKTGKSAYHSMVISRKDKGPASVADLKGRSFAFVDPTSASGHLFPKAGLMAEGFDADKGFSRVIFSGSHDASILAVANKKVDAAAVADVIGIDPRLLILSQVAALARCLARQHVAFQRHELRVHKFADEVFKHPVLASEFEIQGLIPSQ